MKDKAQGGQSCFFLKKFKNLVKNVLVIQPLAEKHAKPVFGTPKTLLACSESESNLYR